MLNLYHKRTYELFRADYLVEEGRGDDEQFLQFLMENVRQCREDEEMKTLGQFLRDEGRREGEQLKALAIAQNLKNLGLELDMIKQATGLSDLKELASKEIAQRLGMSLEATMNSA